MKMRTDIANQRNNKEKSRQQINENQIKKEVREEKRGGDKRWEEIRESNDIIDSLGDAISK